MRYVCLCQFGGAEQSQGRHFVLQTHSFATFFKCHWRHMKRKKRKGRNKWAMRTKKSKQNDSVSCRVGVRKWFLLIQNYAPHRWQETKFRKIMKSSWKSHAWFEMFGMYGKRNTIFKLFQTQKWKYARHCSQKHYLWPTRAGKRGNMGAQWLEKELLLRPLGLRKWDL